MRLLDVITNSMDMSLSKLRELVIDRETMEAVRDLIIFGSKITADGDRSHEIKRCLLLGRKARQPIKKKRHYFVNKNPFSQSYDFSSSHVQM